MMLGESTKVDKHGRFEKEQASPEGEKWQPLSPMYKARKRKNRDKILIRDGNLKNLLRYQVNDSGVEFGSDRK
ncbi:TPA: phage virion morphogenesis protein, partial [Pasteurella multocida]